MIGRVVAGFIAAMLAVLLVHQPIVWLLGGANLKWVSFMAYNMDALKTAPPALASVFQGFGFKGWPTLFNQLFWGGLWGALFGVIHGKLPGGSMILKGLIYGLIILVLSNWIVLPLIRGTPLFANFAPLGMLAGVLIIGGFGAGVGAFYSMLRRNS